MKILHKIKKILFRIMAFLKLLLKEYIPVFFQSKFEDNKVKNILKKIGVVDPEKWNVKKWHFKYRYYVGIYNDKKVFIKLSTRKSWIKHEYEINEYIEKNSDILSCKKADIYLYKEIGKYGIIVEEFISYKCLKDFKIEKENQESIINNLITILEELQRISLIYMDFYEDNIFLDENNNIKLIDFGFSIIKGESIDFIGDTHMKNLIFNNINNKYRLDVGIIDDAISVLYLIKKINPEFMILYHKEYDMINRMSNKLVFKYGDYKNEN